jgi:hypothetical protein
MPGWNGDQKIRSDHTCTGISVDPGAHGFSTEMLDRHDLLYSFTTLLIPGFAIGMFAIGIWYQRREEIKCLYSVDVLDINQTSSTSKSPTTTYMDKRIEMNRV